MPCLLLSARNQYPSVELRTALETLEWVTGERLSAALPRLDFELEGGASFEWPDYIRPSSAIPLFSERLRKLLEENGVSQIDYYPARVTNDSTGEAREYHAANILARAVAMDRVRSEFVPARNHPVMVRAIHRLVLDDARCGDLPMFRLAEYDSLIVVSDSLRLVLEQAGLSGIVLMVPVEWDGLVD